MVVTGSAAITEKEEEVLEGELKELQEMFPDSNLNIQDFLNVALRVGIDFQLEQIRRKEKKC